MAERVERRLAAILAADVAGYSRLIGKDEEGTLAALRSLRRELIDPAIAEHRGRIVKTTGDGMLVEFTSVIDALRCAVAWQAGTPEESPIAWRIGINVGDVVVEDGDIFGDGVNVAARLEALAEPGGICVSARVQEDAAGRLDLAFEDRGEQSLKNIARAVRVYRVRPALTRLAPAALDTLSRNAGEGGPRRASDVVGSEGLDTPALALPDKPSIAVLPFQNMSDDPEQEYFADGMVEEIITALARVRWLFVIARNSSFIYKGQTVDVKQVGRELGVRYVLEGAVRKSGNRVRITAQLIDAATGAHLWADRFDGALEDVFDLQDKVAASAAGVIEPTLQAAEIIRAAARPTSDLTAYDLYLRAYAMFWSSSRRIPEALHLMEQAIARDPHYGPALAWAAVCCLRLLSDELSEDREADRRKGTDFARRALEVAGDDPSILANVTQALAYFGEDIGAMMGLIDRAITLNPNYARAWHNSAVLRVWAGQPDIAIEHEIAAMRFSPRTRVGTQLSTIGAAHFFARRFDEAVPKLLLAIQEDPSYPFPYRWLAACYAHMGRLDDAREIVARLRTITPIVIPDASYLRNPEHRELFLSGLRIATDETG